MPDDAFPGEDVVVVVVVVPFVSANAVIVCVGGKEEDGDDDGVDCVVGSVDDESDAVVSAVEAAGDDVVGCDCGDSGMLVVVSPSPSPPLLLSPLSSGHTPVVHGSTEQHPRKLPLVQTYHCVFPEQLILTNWKG